MVLRRNKRWWLRAKERFWRDVAGRASLSFLPRPTRSE